MVESNLSELPSNEIRSAVCSTVEQILGTKNYTISVTSASQSGDNNFIGIVYRVLFNKVNEKTSSSKLILKVAPQNVARRMQFFSRPCFLREIYMYETVLPYFREFEQSKGVLIDENGFNEYPKCYRTITDEPHECVLLEDLSIRSFTMIDRRTQEVTVDHLRLVMQSLGKLHAISFALKDQQPEKFKELAVDLSEVFIRTDDAHLRDCFTKQAQLAFDAVSDSDDVHLLAKVRQLYERDAIDIAADCLDLKSTGAASVISHGDAWQNNTMFRYDANGKPIEICFLDWQTVRHGKDFCAPENLKEFLMEFHFFIASPVIDIIYYVFCCTTKTLRDTYYDELLKIYHESLSVHIKR